MKTQAHDEESLGSPVSIIYTSDSESDTDTEVKTKTARALGAADYVGGDAAHSRTGHVEETNLFTKIFDKVYEQFQKGHTTEGID